MADNGNITAIGAGGAQNFNRSFTYDQLNRLATMTDAHTPNPCLGLSWTYDAWGNRTDQTVTGGTCNTFHQAVDANNRLTGAPYQYDFAGNMTHDASHSYTYDAENRLTSVDGGSTATYIYDALDRRVSRAIASGTMEYWYDISGNVQGETVSSGTAPNGIYFYSNGNPLGVYRNNTTYFFHKDHLGSTRLVTGLNQAIVQNLDYLPFGELNSSNSAITSHDFTGKERDAESGLDNFGARYDSSAMGRFMSPDPVGGQKIDPQTLNKYSYVRNNPINLTDPTGLYTCKDDNNKCQTKKDIAFEKSRQQDLKSKDADVLRAANSYGDPTKDNHVSVGFADLDKKGEGGVTTSTLGADDKGNLFAQSDVTINSKLSGSALDAAVGHEGSHVADAQDVVSSIAITEGGQNFKVGQDITRYQSEQRAYGVTDSILKSGNENWHFACGFSDCVLGTGQQMLSQRSGVIDQIMANSPLYRSNGQPLSSTNQGGSVVNGVVVPH